MLIWIRAGELHRMPRTRHGERMPMMALREPRTFPLNSAKEAVGGEIVAKTNQIVLTQLIDANHHNQPRPLSREKTASREENNKQRGNSQRKPTHEQTFRGICSRRNKWAGTFDSNWICNFAQPTGFYLFHRNSSQPASQFRFHRVIRQPH